MNFFKGRTFKLGAVATAFTVLFIAAVVFANLLASYATDKLLLKVDMTTTGIYDITTETREMLTTLKDDIEITVLASLEAYKSDMYTSAIPEMLDRYVSLSSGHVSVRYIDPYVNPGELSKYKDIGTPGSNNIIVSGKRNTMLDYADMFIVEEESDPTGLSASSQIISGLQAEQKLTSAIMYVTGEKMPIAVFTQGHKEIDLHALEAILSDANYGVEPLNLSLKDAVIPEDASIMYICGPTADFTTDEISKLEVFQSKGGHVVYLYQFGAPAMPILEAYLAKWGIAVQNSLVLDDVNCYYDESDLAPEALQHKITEGAMLEGLMLRAPLCQPLKVVTSANAQLTVTKIISSSQSSYAKTVKEGETLKSLARADGDSPGPFDVALYGELLDQNGESQSGLLAIPIYFAHDEMLLTDKLANKRIMVDMLSYMSPNAEKAVIIEPRAYPSSAMTVTAGTSIIVFWVVVVFIPLVFLALALTVWMRRRSL